MIFLFFVLFFSLVCCHYFNQWFKVPLEWAVCAWGLPWLPQCQIRVWSSWSGRFLQVQGRAPLWGSAWRDRSSPWTSLAASPPHQKSTKKDYNKMLVVFFFYYECIQQEECWVFYTTIHSFSIWEWPGLVKVPCWSWGGSPWRRGRSRQLGSRCSRPLEVAFLFHEAEGNKKSEIKNSSYKTVELTFAYRYTPPRSEFYFHYFLASEFCTRVWLLAFICYVQRGEERASRLQQSAWAWIMKDTTRKSLLHLPRNMETMTPIREGWQE